jgi:hypothetical protein
MGAEDEAEAAGSQRWAAFHNEAAGTPEATRSLRGAPVKGLSEIISYWAV